MWCMGKVPSEMATSHEKLDRIRREAERQRVYERVNKILKKAAANLQMPPEDIKEWLAQKMKREGSERESSS